MRVNTTTSSAPQVSYARTTSVSCAVVRRVATFHDHCEALPFGATPDASCALPRPITFTTYIDALLSRHMRNAALQKPPERHHIDERPPQYRPQAALRNPRREMTMVDRALDHPEAPGNRQCGDQLVQRANRHKRSGNFATELFTHIRNPDTIIQPPPAHALATRTSSGEERQRESNQRSADRASSSRMNGSDVVGVPQPELVRQPVTQEINRFQTGSNALACAGVRRI